MTEKTGGYNPRIIALMLSATTFVMNFSLIQPIFSLFVIGKGISVINLGLLLSIRSFIPLILRIPMSIIVERIGRIRSMVIGLIISGISSILYLYVQSYGQLLLVVGLSSITNSSFIQTALSTVSDVAPNKKQGDIIGKFLTFVGVGMLLGPVICSSLVESIGYDGLFWISAGAPVIGVILLVFMAPENLQEKEVLRKERPQIGAIESMKMILHNRNVLLLSYLRVSFSTAQSIFLALFSIYAVEQLGFSESIISLLFSVRGLTNTISRYPAGRIGDNVGRKPLLLGGFGLLVVSFVLIAFSRSVLLLGVALGLYGLAWGTRAVSEWAFLTDVIEPEIKTISISYLTSVFSLGATLGSVVAGALTLVLPYSSIFLLGALLNLGAIPAILSIKKDSGNG